MDAVVVGAGPNGLAAALVLAKAGLAVEVHEAADTIGGGARTAELTLPGFRHDVCSHAHPMGLASPFFRAFGLAERGVDLLIPEVSYAHPLDGGQAGVAWRDLDRTVDGLGRDGPAWRRLFGPLDRPGLVDLVMSDFRSAPRDLTTAARFTARVVEQGSPLWGLRFRDSIAPAMLTGVAAHVIAPPRALAPAGAGLVLATLGHTVGWPIPRGGSQSIVDAVAAEFLACGGKIVTGSRIDSLAQVRAHAVLLDVTPTALAAMADLPPRYLRWLRAFRYGGGACKADFALSGPVPWAATDLAKAGTLHLVGSRAEAVAAEREVAAGRHPDRPYVLIGQSGAVDSGRAPTGLRALSTYAHVPNGSTLDLGDTVTTQIERFAPGFRELVLARNVITAADASKHNANYVGGDIGAGALSLWQTVFRPVPQWDAYRTPIPGVYLCSSSTAPGPGVHGMCGVHAAHRVLRQRFGIRTDPLDLIRA
jgi:phytoene dehydrogenase-like protein